MRRRVIPHRCRTTNRFNTQSNGIPNRKGCRRANGMNGECADRTLRIAHLRNRLPAGIKYLPRVTNLSSALGVERGAPNNQLPLFAGRQRRNLDTVAKESQDRTLGVELFVADEFCLADASQDLFVEGGRHGDLRKGSLLAAAAALALLRKGTFETGTVNGNATFRCELNGEIDWEAIRIVQLKGNLATERWTCGWQVISTTANDALPCPEFGERITEQA